MAHHFFIDFQGSGSWLANRCCCNEHYRILLYQSILVQSHDDDNRDLGLSYFDTFENCFCLSFSADKADGMRQTWLQVFIKVREKTRKEAGQALDNVQ